MAHPPGSWKGATAPVATLAMVIGWGSRRGAYSCVPERPDCAARLYLAVSSSKSWPRSSGPMAKRSP